eukprot:scaffold581_cov263-Pinguiococcus_pyrenoidosus.AAC.11
MDTIDTQLDSIRAMLQAQAKAQADREAEERAREVKLDVSEEEAVFSQIQKAAGAAGDEIAFQYFVKAFEAFFMKGVNMHPDAKRGLRIALDTSGSRNIHRTDFYKFWSAWKESKLPVEDYLLKVADEAPPTLYAQAEGLAKIMHVQSTLDNPDTLNNPNNLDNPAGAGTGSRPRCRHEGIGIWCEGRGSGERDAPEQGPARKQLPCKVRVATSTSCRVAPRTSRERELDGQKACERQSRVLVRTTRAIKGKGKARHPTGARDAASPLLGHGTYHPEFRKDTINASSVTKLPTAAICLQNALLCPRSASSLCQQPHSPQDHRNVCENGGNEERHGEHCRDPRVGSDVGPQDKSRYAGEPQHFPLEEKCRGVQPGVPPCESTLFVAKQCIRSEVRQLTCHACLRPRGCSRLLLSSDLCLRP